MLRRPNRVLILSAMIALATLLAGCTATGPADIGRSPPERSLRWFSYLHGADIRQACTAGAPDRARLVYNARYIDQMRAYDLTGRDVGARLEGRVFTGTGLLSMGQGEGLGLADGVPFDRRLTASEAATVWRALDEAGAFRPAPRMGLEGHEVWWLVVGCRDGEVFFNAWRAETPRWQAQAFRQALAPLDPTGIAFAPVQRRGVPIEMVEEMRDFDFRIEVTPDGLLYQ